MTPGDLDAWKRTGLSTARAQAVFAQLAPLPCEAMLGQWDGFGLPTDHPLDGLLEHYGWAGKRFRSADAVDPLLFRRGAGVCALSPARIPPGLIARPPGIARSEWAKRAFRLALPLLTTHRPGARLRPLCRGGQTSAAMVYDQLPIIDHFRRIDADRVMGLMDYRDMPAPFFFMLTRARSSPGAGPPRPRRTADSTPRQSARS